MALQEDLGGPMTVTDVSWMRTIEGDDWGTYLDVQIHMGLCSSDDLGAIFDENYIPGSRTPVFSTDSLYLEGETGEWVTIHLEEPFDYQGAGNLVIEIQREGTADNTFLMTYRWYSHEYRTVSSPDPYSVAGSRDRVSSMLRIDFDEYGLQPSTWAGVKSLFGPPI
jgi:hypothetical protein